MTTTKQKAHVVMGTTNQQPNLQALNADIAGGWKIVDVHQSSSGAGTSAYWLVIIEERIAGSGNAGD